MNMRTTLLTLGLAACPTLAMALPISVGVNLGTASNEGIDANSFDPAAVGGDTSIDFTSTSAFTNVYCDEPVVIGLCSGAVSASSVTLDSGAPAWTLTWGGGLTYTTASTWTVQESSDTFTIQTIGFYSALGYDSTAGVLNISFQDPINGGRYSFSASGGTSFDNVPTSVPEPATLSLLGAGLLGMGILGRRRRRS